MAATNSLTTSSGVFSPSVPLPNVPPPNGHCVWWDLPRELRDSVYKMAYARKGKLSVMTTSLWDVTQRNKSRRARLQDRDYTLVPFPYYMDRFLVNKQYATEAYAAFISTTHFEFGLCNRILDSGTQRAFFELTTLTMRFTDLITSGYAVHKCMPHLRSLTIHATTLDFDLSIGGIGYGREELAADLMFDKITEDKVRGVTWWKDFECVRGLRKVNFTGKEILVDKLSERNKQTMRENIEVIKAALTKSLKRPKEIAKPKVEKTKQKTKVTKTLSFVDLTSTEKLWKQPKSSTSKARASRVVKKKQPVSQPKDKADLTITDEDLPVNDNDILDLVRNNPEGVAAWMASARTRLKVYKQEG